ncbi:long-chain-acyl-CoA synthetase [Gammaproteobacteria bacterium]|nr:long-chain-acyl-CoA synthetase [Gammaproteobacteria bacterium]
MRAITSFLGDLKVLLVAATTKPPPPDQIASFSLLVEGNAARVPNAIALMCEEEVVDWKELNERANRIANTLKAAGIRKGDCVSLFMQNRIEFVVQAVAAGKLGAIAGLINTNLTRQQLVHCISLTESKKIVFGEELTEPLNEVRNELTLEDGKDYLFVRDTGEDPAPNWATELDSNDTNSSCENPPESRQVETSSTAFYIFTSGTTGLPKAARVSNRRMLPAAKMSATALLRIKQTDRMYNCLPLYHGTGLMIGLTAAFTVAASTVIRRRLSVSAFWDDIRKYECTSFVYIGEFIRYLMSQPETIKDKANPVRTIVGNGLRPDIWHDFKNRFDIERIGEFYGASEGNGGFANVFNKNCTVGLGTAPAKIVAYDIANDEIVKDEDGYCIEQSAGEPGLLLIEITGKSEFEGYTNKDASSKKVTKNVFNEGDSYFNTGDLMKVVDVGFAFGQRHYQFVDRVGDTFRWKSENVSTNEVGEIINQHEDIIFTNVYGVEIPGTDGRAGMAAIVLKEHIKTQNINLESLSEHIRENLPSYARPIFIRLLAELPTTTTHKLQKNDLRGEAYHFDKVSDHMFVMRPGEATYSKLDSDFYDKIAQREVHF